MKRYRLSGLVFLLVGLSLTPYRSVAQYFVTGNDPVSTRWFQIKQPGFRILFPEESKDQAVDMANFLTTAIPAIGSSLKHQPAKFPLSIHSFSSVSNGYTIWAPSRIELFPRPPVIGGAESYADHLLIHEVRHMVQMDKLDIGITHALSYLLGQQAVAAVIGLQMSSWYSEGDAVLTETLLSQSGRGRQALFHEGLRALWLSEDTWSLDKALFGSYRDFVPNHYVLGYHMVSTARMLGGPYIWAGALDRMGRKPWQVALMSRYLTEQIGLNKTEMYDKARSWARSTWLSVSHPAYNPPLVMWVRDTLDYFHYIKPIAVGPDEFVLLKKGLGILPEFVLYHSTGHEEHLLYPGYMDEAAFDVSRNLLVWAEDNPDIRWEHRSFNNLYLYNLETRETRQITSKARLYSPSLSPAADQVACVEYLPQGVTRLSLISVNTGQLLNNWEPPAGETVQMPDWGESGTIWFMTTGRSGKKIYRYSVEDQSVSLVSEPGFQEVFNVQEFNHRLFFIGPNQGANAVFELDLVNGETGLIAEDSLGINYLTSGQDQLACSVYRLHGYKPAAINTDKAVLPKAIHAYHDPYLPLLSRTPEEQTPTLKALDESDFQVKRYRKAFHPLRFHSWAPISLNTDTYGIKPGAMLLSQNDLGTMTARIGVEYDWNFRRPEFFTAMAMPGWPVETNLDARTYADVGTFQSVRDDTTKLESSYRNYQGSIRMSLPLDFSKGRWNTGLIIASILGYNYYELTGSSSTSLGNRQYLHAGAGFKAYSLSRRAYRDLYPKWGYQASLTAMNQLSWFEGDGKTQISSSLQVYLPGFLPNHSTRLYAGANILNGWLLPDQSGILMPRGMYRNFHDYSASCKMDYAFPFGYPDWSLGPVLYVKRLKANVFADLAVSPKDNQNLFLSSGIDLTSDFNVLRIGLNFDAGVRLLYNFAEQKPGVEWLMNFAVN